MKKQNIHTQSRIVIPRALSLCAVTASALALLGCSSTVSQRAQNSDGLVEFIADKPGNNPPVVIEKVSNGGGEIKSAHLKVYGSKVYVKGLVTRRPAGNLPPWTHVDVIVTDKSNKVVEGFAVNYMPRDIPYGNRGQMPQSQYIVRLASMPAKDSTVKVVLHIAHENECEFGNQS